MQRAASRSAGCRDFWAVERWGRDQSAYNESYQLVNHINMAMDMPRLEAYRAALEQLAAGRRVLDVGGGAFSLLSRLALRAGATSVDCVEQSEGSVAHAAALLAAEARGIECEGLRDIGASLDSITCDGLQATVGKQRLQLLQGCSTDVELNGGYELVVQEVLGHVASAEGVAIAMLDLSHRGLLAQDCVFVPCCARTLFAPTAQIECTMAEQAVSLKYGGEITDLRCGTKYHAARFGRESFLALPAVFEELEFGPHLKTHQVRTVEFQTTRDGVFDGLHFHMEVDVGGGGSIDTLEDETSWQTTYVRLLEPGIFLRAGSKIVAKTSADFTTPTPMYKVEVSTGGPTGPVTASFDWSGST